MVHQRLCTEPIIGHKAKAGVQTGALGDPTDRFV